jgi:hypothetical protein
LRENGAVFAGVDVLHAADLFAPAPPVGGGGGSDKASAGMPYDDAIELIANAVSKVDPSMVRATHNALFILISFGIRGGRPFLNAVRELKTARSRVETAASLNFSSCVLLQPFFKSFPCSLSLRVGVTTQTNRARSCA